ncbi:hypothetical protein E2C01_030277 [Portunus trituberculatus]|uniref:Uncharacterized protein n=1 Tax=Portunus trituberculatus TaxID=210409 RepID=A0A5B7EQ11_PORTR|nr:hypothetical protein [Portunus trituberculatus]
MQRQPRRPPPYGRVTCTELQTTRRSLIGPDPYGYRPRESERTSESSEDNIEGLGTKVVVVVEVVVPAFMRAKEENSSLQYLLPLGRLDRIFLPPVPEVVSRVCFLGTATCLRLYLWSCVCGAVFDVVFVGL